MLHWYWAVRVFGWIVSNGQVHKQRWRLAPCIVWPREPCAYAYKQERRKHASEQAECNKLPSRGNEMRDNIYSFGIWFPLIEVISNMFRNHYYWQTINIYANTNAIKLLLMSAVWTTMIISSVQALVCNMGCPYCGDPHPTWIFQRPWGSGVGRVLDKLSWNKIDSKLIINRFDKWILHSYIPYNSLRYEMWTDDQIWLSIWAVEPILQDK